VSLIGIASSMFILSNKASSFTEYNVETSESGGANTPNEALEGAILTIESGGIVTDDFYYHDLFSHLPN
ncbi:1335_t:CDS:2, partial [Entrophospora sp. SA101]